MGLTSRMNAWKKFFIFPLRYCANCVSTTVKVLAVRNVESVYFFYSNPVFCLDVEKMRTGKGIPYQTEEFVCMKNIWKVCDRCGQILGQGEMQVA